MRFGAHPNQPRRRSAPAGWPALVSARAWPRLALSARPAAGLGGWPAGRPALVSARPSSRLALSVRALLPGVVFVARLFVERLFVARLFVEHLSACYREQMLAPGRERGGIRGVPLPLPPSFPPMGVLCLEGGSVGAEMSLRRAWVC